MRIRASAPSLHIIRAEVNTEISPLVATEKQSEEMAEFLKKEMAENPEGVWDTNMFGKTLSAMIGDELTSRAGNMPQDARDKVSELLGPHNERGQWLDAVHTALMRRQQRSLPMGSIRARAAVLALKPLMNPAISFEWRVFVYKAADRRIARF